jgi:hypothetical protein
MLNHYKKIVISAYIGFMLTGIFSLNAQTIEPNKQQAVTNYSVALQSENPGVVESALFHSVLFKKTYHEQPSEPLIDGITYVYHNGTSTRLRHKAYLIHSLLNIPGLWDSLEINKIENEQDFYKAISELINKELLSAN